MTSFFGLKDKPPVPALSNEPSVAAQVKVRVDVPQPIFDRYSASAATKNQDVEVYIGEHLRQTAGQDHTGAGIWFSAEQAAKLCKLTGRGSCTDADQILQRLKPLLEILVGDVIVELDAQIIDRLKHIPRNKTVPQFVSREALNGIRGSLGLSLK